MTCRYHGEMCNISCPGLIKSDDKVNECNGNGQCVLVEGSEDQYQCKCTDSKFGREDCSPVEDDTPTVLFEEGICSGRGIYEY